MFAGKKSAQIREILISESAWEEMTCLFAPSLAQVSGSLADEDIIAKLLVESDPHKIIALFNSATESADA